MKTKYSGGDPTTPPSLEDILREWVYETTSEAISNRS
jgi:hypothetical protein